jgi:hypothetical protein
MGDTQKSPTISTDNQGIAAKAAGDSGHGMGDPIGDGPPLLVGESSLARIRMLAESEPDLVFTFYWSKSRRSYWVIKKITAGKRLSRFVKGRWRWCRNNRHEPVKEQYRRLCSKLRGYYQYFDVRSNYKALEVVFEYAQKAWRFWLSRRSHKGGISWKKFEKIRTIYPLPKPMIVHNI